MDDRIDKLSCKEIKQMINARKLNIQELDASLLRRLMNYEIDMLCLGEGDVDFVCKCSDLLEEIEPCPISNEEFMAIVKKTQEERVVILEDEPKFTKARKKRFILKRVIAIAAAILILSVTTVGVASAFGVNIGEELYKIVLQEDGARKDVDGITFYHSGEAKYYSSIEELEKAENANILYPTKLPKNIVIDKISVTKTSWGSNTIHLFTNDDQIKITVDKNAPKDDWTENEQECVYGTNGIKYLFYTDENFHFAFAYYNSDYYSIQAGTQEDLILIIDNLKEIEK